MFKSLAHLNIHGACKDISDLFSFTFWWFFRKLREEKKKLLQVFIPFMKFIIPKNPFLVKIFCVSLHSLQHLFVNKAVTLVHFKKINKNKSKNFEFLLTFVHISSVFLYKFKEGKRKISRSVLVLILKACWTSWKEKKFYEKKTLPDPFFVYTCWSSFKKFEGTRSLCRAGMPLHLPSVV